MSKLVDQLKKNEFIQKYTNIENCHFNNDGTVTVESLYKNEEDIIIKNYCGECIPVIFNNDGGNYGITIADCKLFNLKNLPQTCNQFCIMGGYLDNFYGMPKIVEQIMINKLSSSADLLTLAGMEETKIKPGGSFIFFNSNQFNTLQHFPQITSLDMLNISYTNLCDFKYMPSASANKVVISKCNLQTFEGWDLKVKTLDASDNYLKTTKGLKNVSEKLILYNNDLETLDDELSENDVKKSFIADDNYIKSIDNLKISPRNISLNHNQLTHLGDNILCNEKIQEMSFQENNFNDVEKNRIIKTLTKYNEKGERYIFIL